MKFTKLNLGKHWLEVLPRLGVFMGYNYLSVEVSFLKWGFKMDRYFK